MRVSLNRCMRKIYDISERLLGESWWTSVDMKSLLDDLSRRLWNSWGLNSLDFYSNWINPNYIKWYEHLLPLVIRACFKISSDNKPRDIAGIFSSSIKWFDMWSDYQTARDFIWCLFAFIRWGELWHSTCLSRDFISDTLGWRANLNNRNHISILWSIFEAYSVATASRLFLTWVDAEIRSPQYWFINTWDLIVNLSRFESSERTYYVERSELTLWNKIKQLRERFTRLSEQDREKYAWMVSHLSIPVYAWHHQKFPYINESDLWENANWEYVEMLVRCIESQLYYVETYWETMIWQRKEKTDAVAKAWLWGDKIETQLNRDTSELQWKVIEYQWKKQEYEELRRQNNAMVAELDRIVLDIKTIKPRWIPGTRLWNYKNQINARLQEYKPEELEINDNLEINDDFTRWYDKLISEWEKLRDEVVDYDLPESIDWIREWRTQISDFLGKKRDIIYPQDRSLDALFDKQRKWNEDLKKAWETWWTYLDWLKWNAWKVKENYEAYLDSQINTEFSDLKLAA